mgnify:CR=1 FL=1
MFVTYYKIMLLITNMVVDFHFATSASQTIQYREQNALNWWIEKTVLMTAQSGSQGSNQLFAMVSLLVGSQPRAIHILLSKWHKMGVAYNNMNCIAKSYPHLQKSRQLLSLKVTFTLYPKYSNFPKLLLYHARVSVLGFLQLVASVLVFRNISSALSSWMVIHGWRQI